VKWEKELTLTSNQQTEIERLRKKIIQLQLVVANILELADELKYGMIEKVMAKSDFEIGIEYLKKHL
jgi:hypothetical protein